MKPAQLRIYNLCIGCHDRYPENPEDRGENSPPRVQEFCIGETLERYEMTRTLVQIRRQIESLEREAEAIRDKEIAGVVARIKEAIAFYGLSTDDLFEGNAKKDKRRAVGASVSAKKLATKKASVAKFRDEATGKTWTGHGKRPGWFVDAIASGKSPEDLAVKP